MIELVPWMLILAWWNPAEPGNIRIERERTLFATEERCQLAGREMAAGVEMYAVEHEGQKLTFLCTQVPEPGEYDRVFMDWGSQQDPVETEPSTPVDTTGNGQ